MRLPFPVGLLEIQDQQKSRWVLVQVGDAPADRAQWSFPVFRVGLDGESDFAAGVQISIAGQPIRIPRPADFNAAAIPTTRVRVTDLAQLELSNIPTKKSRPIHLAGIADIEHLISNGALSASSVALWVSHWSAAVD